MSLYELFFEMEIGICDRFPSLSPFDVRQKQASEVFLLIRRLNNYNDYRENEKSRKNKRVIRKQAGDDWF